MTNSQDNFQQQVLDRLDALKRSDDELRQEFDGLRHEVDSVSHKVEGLSNNVEKFNDRFSAYQQGTQWVVQLAFTLIASATLTVIITSVLKR